MSENPDTPSPPRGRSARPEYEVHRSGDGARAGGSSERPYTTYRSLPRGLVARLRGESDPDLSQRRLLRPGRRGDARPPLQTGPWWRRRRTWIRAVGYLVLAVVAWLALSLVLFVVSAEIERGKLPAAAVRELKPGGNMLTSTDTVLILGTDQRPRTGPGSKEPGANHNDAGSRSDTIMLWRIGGGTSRRLSIPRDTLAEIPGHGENKINAAYALGGPALAIKTVERFTGLQINHVIVVNLAAFPAFINAIGGVDVRTGRVCSNISGGRKLGGFSLYLRPGVHHLNGIQALTYARTRENACNAHDSDLTRVLHQQQILNAIRSKLTSPSTFVRLPWASWDAPKVLRTDMGGFTLMSLFAASEIGGSAPPKELKPTGYVTVPGIGDSLEVSHAAVRAAVQRLLDG
jgi:LCP family protein required for cell wall assembly